MAFMSDLKKLAEVNRYYIPVPVTSANIAKDGEWVRYSDYTTLLQEVETLRAEVGRLTDALIDKLARHEEAAPQDVGFTEQTAAAFKAAGYNPQLIWFSDKGGEWQLWMYPQKAMAFSTHFSGQSIAAVVRQGLAAIEDGETKL